MHVFKHPKFYEDMRKKRKQFQKEQKQQASSSKPQASSVKPQSLKHWFKLQAASNKLPDPLALIKFWDHARGILNQDKSIVWVFHVEGDLMWRECYFVCFCIF